MVIGGLIVISLLTYSPAGDYVTGFNKAISGNALIMLERGAKELQASINNEVEIVLNELEINSNKLNVLLKQKKLMVAKVEQTMQELCAKSVRLTETQMLAYKDYSDDLQMKNYSITANLSKIGSDIELLPIKNELLAVDTDYGYVYNGIAEISNLQRETSGILQTVTNAANDMLTVLGSQTNT